MPNSKGRMPKEARMPNPKPRSLDFGLWPSFRIRHSGFGIRTTTHQILPRTAEVGDALLRFLDALWIGFVSGDLAIDFEGALAFFELAVVEVSGAKTGVEMCLRIPLEAALEVEGGTAILAVGLGLVDIAELVSNVGNLVALWI